MNTKRIRKLIIRPSPTATGSRSSSGNRHDERTPIALTLALGYAAPHASGIRVPQAGGEERIGNDDRERGAPVERERARCDGERQAWVDERAEVCGRELRAWRARRRREDRRFFL